MSAAALEGSAYAVVGPVGGESGGLLVWHVEHARLHLFKPSAAEADVIAGLEHCIRPGSFVRRAVAAAAVLSLLGVPTPAVQAAVIDGQAGSLQGWASTAPSLRTLRAEDPARAQRLLATASVTTDRSSIVVVDFLLGNLDRNEGNVLLAGARRPGIVRCIPVDHDLCFPPTPFRGSVPAEAMAVADPTLIERLGVLGAAPDRLVGAVATTLAPVERAGLLDRLAALVAAR